MLARDRRSDRELGVLGRGEGVTAGAKIESAKRLIGCASGGCILHLFFVCHQIAFQNLQSSRTRQGRKHLFASSSSLTVRVAMGHGPKSSVMHTYYTLTDERQRPAAYDRMLA